MANEQSGSEPTELERKIIEQMEYYFGDTNLRKDRFLKEQIAANDGWVDMDTMLKFRRLQQLSEDKEVICAAVRKSTNGLIDVSEGNDKVRRSSSKPVEEMTEDVKKDLNKRTGYAKGFLESTTLDEIKNCLSKAGFGSKAVKGITMRRFLDSRLFKGSIFIEFATVEDCERFGSLETPIRLSDDAEPLSCLTREAYYQKKSEERREQKLQAKAKLGIGAEGGDAKKEDEPFESGCVLRFVGCGEDTRRETLRELFGRFEDVAWVNFKMDDKEGEIRFASTGGAGRALDKVKEEGDGKVTINGVESTCSVLEGDDEKKYWDLAREEMAQVKARTRAARGGGRGRGRGGRGRGRGRGGFKRRGDWSSAPRAKRAKE